MPIADRDHRTASLTTAASVQQGRRNCLRQAGRMRVAHHSSARRCQELPAARAGDPRPPDASGSSSPAATWTWMTCRGGACHRRRRRPTNSHTCPIVVRVASERFTWTLRASEPGVGGMGSVGVPPATETRDGATPAMKSLSLCPTAFRRTARNWTGAACHRESSATSDAGSLSGLPRRPWCRIGSRNEDRSVIGRRTGNRRNAASPP